MVNSVSQFTREEEQWCVLLSEGDCGILGKLDGVCRVLCARGSHGACAVRSDSSSAVRVDLVRRCHGEDVLLLGVGVRAGTEYLGDKSMLSAEWRYVWIVAGKLTGVNRIES